MSLWYSKAFGSLSTPIYQIAFCAQCLCIHIRIGGCTFFSRRLKKGKFKHCDKFRVILCLFLKFIFDISVLKWYEKINLKKKNKMKK